MKLTLFNRILAVIYDVIIQVFLLIGIYILAHFISSEYLPYKWMQTTLIISLGIIVALIYFGLLPLKLKGTIGKYMADLEVVATKGRFTMGRWLFRELIFKYLYPYIGLILLMLIEPFHYKQLGIYLGIGFIGQFLFLIVKRTTIHDYILKTKVINKEISE